MFYNYRKIIPVSFGQDVCCSDWFTRISGDIEITYMWGGGKLGQKVMIKIISMGFRSVTAIINSKTIFYISFGAFKQDPTDFEIFKFW